MEPPHRLDAIGLTEALAALGSILEHRALAPTPEELATARDWCAEQDSSEAFRDGLDLVVSQLANEVRNG